MGRRRELLAALAGAFGQDAANADPQRKSKAFNSAKVGAHHAIIPTANVPELNVPSEPERTHRLVLSTHVLFQANGHRSVSDASAKREFTKPPPRYAMKTLLKDLAQVTKYITDPKIKELFLNKDADNGGIGTPATRDAHI